jgi:hypothetical protein
MTAYDASAEIKNTPALMWIFILNVWKFIYIHIRMNIEEFYKLKYCSTVVYMVPRA